MVSVSIKSDNSVTLRGIGFVLTVFSIPGTRIFVCLECFDFGEWQSERTIILTFNRASFPQVSPAGTPQGYPGNLSPEQEEKVKELRTALQAKGFEVRLDDASLVSYC